MTRVCLVGDEEVSLRYELLSRETARNALSTYDLQAPYENSIELETVSLGAAVSLLNDLNWYLVRFVDEALVLEPSISHDEWLSRDLARAVRDDEIEPVETDRLYKIYGVERPTDATADEEAGQEPVGGRTASADGVDESRSPTEDDRSASGDGENDAESDGDGENSADAVLPRLVEPMYVTRTGGEVPAYDIRDVDETLRVRVTESEFEA